MNAVNQVPGCPCLNDLTVVLREAVKVVLSQQGFSEFVEMWKEGSGRASDACFHYPAMATGLLLACPLRIIPLLVKEESPS